MPKANGVPFEGWSGSGGDRAIEKGPTARRRVRPGYAIAILVLCGLALGNLGCRRRQEAAGPASWGGGPRVEVRVAQAESLRIVPGTKEGNGVIFGAEVDPATLPLEGSRASGGEANLVPATFAAGSPSGSPSGSPAGSPAGRPAGLPAAAIEARLEGRLIAIGAARYRAPVEIRLRSTVAGGGLGTGAGGRGGAGEGGVPEPQDFLALALDVDGAAELRRFRGGFVIEIEDGRLSLTNNTSLEEYVAGVVGAEMPASWPLEALKAQAIASRSFALHALLDGAERGRRTLLGAGESFQVYRGLESEHPRVLEAVRATRGEVLAFRGRLVRTSFHSTCGGRTRNAWEVFADPKVDCYRGVECKACAGSRRALWTGRLSAEEVETALAPWLATRGIRLGALSCLEVSERDEGGAVRYLRLSDGRVSFELSGVRFRALLLAKGIDRVRSCAYDVVSDSGQFVFGGRGWGHGVGMCQVGAGRLGRTLSSREILSSYYPSSEVMVVY